MTDIASERVDTTYDKLLKETEEAGYRLNPDVKFTKDLVKALLVNEDRYGYRACPCRLASGDRQADLDIICPCDYRDPDIDEFGTCYCALYVSEEVFSGTGEVRPIPDRRPPKEEREAADKRGTEVLPETSEGLVLSAPSGEYPLWRCKVCGYVCARNEPPGRCPVCKATRDRFERLSGLG